MKYQNAGCSQHTFVLNKHNIGKFFVVFEGKFEAFKDFESSDERRWLMRRLWVGTTGKGRRNSVDENLCGRGDGWRTMVWQRRVQCGQVLHGSTPICGSGLANGIQTRIIVRFQAIFLAGIEIEQLFQRIFPTESCADSTAKNAQFLGVFIQFICLIELPCLTGGIVSRSRSLTCFRRLSTFRLRFTTAFTLSNQFSWICTRWSPWFTGNTWLLSTNFVRPIPLMANRNSMI